MNACFLRPVIHITKAWKGKNQLNGLAIILADFVPTFNSNGFEWFFFYGSPVRESIKLLIVDRRLSFMHWVDAKCPYGNVSGYWLLACNTNAKGNFSRQAFFQHCLHFIFVQSRIIPRVSIIDSWNCSMGLMSRLALDNNL